MTMKHGSAFWQHLTLALLILSPTARPVYGESVEELLREADLTLRGKPSRQPQGPRKTPRTTSEPARNEAPTRPVSPDEAVPAEVKTHFNPTEAAQILRADLKAIHDEQTQRDPRVDFSVLAGRLDFSPSFQLYKDDDTFQLSQNARWTGATFDMSAAWTLVRVGPIGLLGLTAGSLGFYSGTGVVRRTGVQSRTSEMRLMTVPLDVGIGLGIAWRDLVQIIFRGGPSLNVLNQRGQGTQDTLSGVFGGDYGVTSLRVRVTSDWSLRADFRKQGLLNRNLISESLIFGATYNLH